MAEHYETVRVDVTDGIGTVTVDRPESMNAVNGRVVEELASAVSTLQSDDDVAVIVLTGAGDDAFIAGGDITNFRDQTGVDWRIDFRMPVEDLEAALEGGRKPVIAAVNGVALGGGTEIAMMCDIIVAAASARFGLPEITLGIIPGAGGTQRLVQLVGYLRAKELVLTGRQVPAEEAARIGLVNEVVPNDEFDERVTELAGELAAGSRTAQWFAKEAVNRARGEIETGLDIEKALAALAFETADKDEGMAAFVDRRDPEFGDGYR